MNIDAKRMNVSETECPRDSSDSLWDSRCHGIIRFVQSLTWIDRRESFYEVVAEQLCNLSGADNVNIRLLSADRGQFVLYAKYGDLGSEPARRFGMLSAEAGRMPQLLKTRSPILFDLSDPDEEDIAWDTDAAYGYAQAVTVALSGKQGVVGACDFLFRTWEPRSSQEIDWLCELGELAGAIVENALITDKMMSLRAAEERRSLSNEIHDNIAQVVSTISMLAENASRSLEDGDTDYLERQLDLMKQASDEAQVIARSELENLHRDRNFGDVTSMEQYEHMIAAFCVRWGLGHRLESDGASKASLIPGRIAIQLERAVNEALVNVVRHANASEVSIAYRVDENGLSMRIADDGCGFDAANVDSTHLGLRIMRERMAAVGGTVEIDSRIGCGTKVLIRIPYLV